MRTTLFIDGKPVALDGAAGFELPIGMPSEKLAAAEGAGFRVSIPVATANPEAAGDVSQIFSRGRFNASRHSARIETDGCVVFRGEIHLDGVRYGAAGDMWYDMVMTSPSAGWIRNASEEMLNEIPVEFEETLGTQSIRESWTWNKPVKFLPVQRDTLLVQNSGGAVISPARVLTPEDYHPFLHIKTLMQAVFAKAGYRIVSSFMETPLFESLYMSGNYPQQDTAKLKARVNFRAGRFSDVTAVADRYGTVRADPYSALNSLGNLVETANPNEVRGGQSAAGVFNTNDVFRIVDGRAAFVPLTEVQAGFEFNIKYRTPYTILSRGELSGFNSVSLGDGIEHNFRIVNRFGDRREEFATGRDYLLVVFDHTSGTSYQVRYDRKAAGTTQNVVYGTFASRTGPVTIPSGAEVYNMSVWIKPQGSADYVPYAGDWALYDGYVTETGTTEVEVCLRSAPQKITPSSPKYFDTVYFNGAPQGSQLTPCKETYIRPVFSANPAVGSKVRFADVAAHRVRQIELFEAVAHMFNLRFHTDDYSREVFVEPYGGFQDGTVTVDWSSQLDFSKPVVIEEPGAGMYRTTVLAYKEGDDSVDLGNARNGTDMGSWSIEIGSTLAKDKVKTVRNPLLTPTISLSGGYPDAPSALFLQVGERDPYPVERNDSMNFPARIVRYIGMRDLPAGEVWGWPSYTVRYPFAAFHYHGSGNAYSGDEPNPQSSFSPDTATLIENGFSLCFEDRDGVAGLHRFHDAQYGAAERSRRITAYVRLAPDDIEAFVVPNSLRRDFRALFRIALDGEPVVCRLEAIGGYAPLSQESVKCVFLTV